MRCAQFVKEVLHLLVGERVPSARPLEDRLELGHVERAIARGVERLERVE